MDYINTMQQSLNFIENNLDENLSLKIISNNIFISSYHFSRIFKAILGISIYEYIKRRRLSEAANLLATTNIKIIEVAFKFNFKSQESFSVAFKKYFHYTPYIFRKESPDIVIYPKAELYLANLKIKNLKGSAYMEYKIIKKNELKLIGIKERIFLPNNNTIPKLWETFIINSKNIKNKKNNCYYGIASNMKIRSSLASSITTEVIDEFDEMISIEVSSFDNIPKGMVTKIIAPQKYLVFTYKGNVNCKNFIYKIKKTYDYLYGSLLPATEFEVDKEFNFELYDKQFKENDDNSKFDIYIPIK